MIEFIDTTPIALLNSISLNTTASVTYLTIFSHRNLLDTFLNKCNLNLVYI